MILIHLLLVLSFFLLGSTPGEAAIEVPLTVRETYGVDRHQWPTRVGLPLPKGALKSVEKLQILDAQGRFVPAIFSVANRWWEDGSIQWLHCDFAATVAPNSQTGYVLREVVSLPEFPSPMGFIPRGKSFEVITGPLRFSIGGESNQLFDEVWVDEGWGYNFNEQTKILDSGNFDLVLTSGGRTFRTSHWTQNRIEVEEHNALRAVVKITGSFALAGSKEKQLDYIARMTTYGGKTFLRFELTVLNRSDTEFPIDDLSFSFKLNLDLTQQKFIFGGEQQDHTGNFESEPQALLSQDSPGSYSVSGAVKGTGSGKSPRVGWVDLSDGEHGLSAGVRWFGRLYPKALQVRNDSTLAVKLFPSHQPALALPGRRVKTHEMVLHFHGKRQLASGQVKNVMLGFQQPVYVVAPPAWYCRTQAIGRLLESSAGLVKPEFESLAARMDGWLTASRQAILATREKSGAVSDPVSYGVFRFGNALPTSGAAADSKSGVLPNAPGDFAHALYLHFFRTGDLESLQLAEETLASIADSGLMVEEPGQNQTLPQSNSAARRDRSYGVEGLAEAYFFTGNRRFLNAVQSMASRIAREGSTAAHDPAKPAARSIALMKGFTVTGDRRWLEAAKGLLETLFAWQDGDRDKLNSLAPVLAAQWNEGFKGSLGRTAWECAAVWSALQHYQMLSGDRSVLARMQRSAQWLQQNPNEWNGDRQEFISAPYAGLVLAPGLAALSEENGSDRFFKLAREAFEKAVGAPSPIEDSGLFGAVFTSGQYFPWFLSKEFQPGAKRDVSLLN